MTSRYFVACSLSLLILLVGCGSNPSVCGDGTELEHESRSYCVYDLEGIADEDFRCPESFQFRFDFTGFTACGANSTQPPETFDAFARMTLDPVPSAGPDASADATPSLAGDCPSETMCFDLRRFGSATEGRVLVMWFMVPLYRENIGVWPEPEIGYDMPVGADETELRIPLSEIQPPTDAMLICERDAAAGCADPAMCPCTGEVQFAVGGVFFMYSEGGVPQMPTFHSDGLYADGSGRNQANGVAPLVMTYGARAYDPQDRIDEREIRGFAPEGLEAGVRPNATQFVLVDSPFNQVFPTSLRRFEFRICEAIDNSVCEVRIHFT